MNNSKALRVRTTIGELVAGLYDETQSFSNSNDSGLIVAYILNDLMKNSAGISSKNNAPRLARKG